MKRERAGVSERGRGRSMKRERAGVSERGEREEHEEREQE